MATSGRVLLVGKRARVLNRLADALQREGLQVGQETELDRVASHVDVRAVDVVALACTHFPLLAQELAAAAPRACMWLDSGAAIARRVGDVTGAEPGSAHAERAAFTDANAAGVLFRAFETRGFSSFASIADAPGYVVTPLA